MAIKLDSEGIEAIYDDVILSKYGQSLLFGERISPHRSTTHLPRFGGVPFLILLEIQACDVIIQLSPSTSVTRPDEMQQYKELADVALEVLSVSPEFASALGFWSGNMSVPYAATAYKMQVLWYETFYEIDIRKQGAESWQEWEIRVGKLIGISFVRVRLARGTAAAQSRESSALVINSDNLENEIAKVLIPYLRTRRLTRKKPRPLPAYRALFAVGRGVGTGINAYTHVEEALGNAARRIKRWVK
jgi:hypothetical protein